MIIKSVSEVMLNFGLQKFFDIFVVSCSHIALLWFCFLGGDL